MENFIVRLASWHDTIFPLMCSLTSVPAAHRFWTLLFKLNQAMPAACSRDGNAGLLGGRSTTLVQAEISQLLDGWL